MDKIIEPIGNIKGVIEIPSSKSYGQRVLACALINKEETIISNLGISDDEQAILQLITDFGANISFEKEKIIVQGNTKVRNSKLELNCNESGLGARMITPILSNQNIPITLNAKGSLLNRPMRQFDEILEMLNVKFKSNDGKLPFDIQGPLVPRSIQIDGSLSSQFVTGMILGYVASPLLRNEAIEIINPTSIPYIELTLDVLAQFGVELKMDNNKLQFDGPYTLKQTNIRIESDWSSASFFLVAAAILGDVTFIGLNIDSKQADKRILGAIADFGAEIIFEENSIRIIKKENNPFEFDATHCPDLFPPLAVLASFASGISRIKGVSRLKHKESDRASSIKEELNKMGGKISNVDDVMIIEGIHAAKSARINPHGDHRIAMASAIMGLKSDGVTIIENSEVVKKSFPAFFDFLNKLI